ncbi:MAG: hypothetical protein OEW67_04110 [Cyclobacteriaceae bacterium]|nr:hypothetical protein [Cyclobacteriaceae bacterium]
MKNTKILFATILVLSFAAITSCKEDTTAPDPKQQVIDALSKAWTVNSVTLDNQDVSADWNSFTLTFDNTQAYITTSPSYKSTLIWPLTGSYTFPNIENPRVILRNDGVLIFVSNLTDNSLQLIFSITNTGGRTEGLTGEWIFDMGS